MRVLLLALLLTLIGGTAAQAQLTLCNRTNQPLEAAVVGENDVLDPYSEGWVRIAPNACVKAAHNSAVDYAYYVRQTKGSRTWDGGPTGPRLCVDPAKDFGYGYWELDEELLGADKFECRPGQEKRSFIKLPNPNGNNYTIDLR